MKNLLFGMALAVFGAFNAQAVTVTNAVVADTTLHEGFPNNNLGGLATLAAGKTPSFGRLRGLMKFDMTGVPAGSTITAVEVRLTLTKESAAGGAVSNFGLHRVLKNWTEGNKTGFTQTGDFATDGETTWTNLTFPSVFWELGGASSTNDAVTNASSSLSMDNAGPYVIPSSSALVADVQGWLTDPSSNFGWMLRSDAEATDFTARRFASKESGANAPKLIITYSSGPPADLKIGTFSLTANGMNLTWNSVQPNYRVQRASNVLGPWTDVTTTSATPSATAAPKGPDPTTFYRVQGALPLP